jgi:hypothetical protein
MVVVRGGGVGFDARYDREWQGNDEDRREEERISDPDRPLELGRRDSQG